MALRATVTQLQSSSVEQTEPRPRPQRQAKAETPTHATKLLQACRWMRTFTPLDFPLSFTLLSLSGAPPRRSARVSGSASFILHPIRSTSRLVVAGPKAPICKTRSIVASTSPPSIPLTPFNNTTIAATRLTILHPITTTTTTPPPPPPPAAAAAIHHLQHRLALHLSPTTSSSTTSSAQVRIRHFAKSSFS